MVSHINVALDDELVDRAAAVREANDWTWPEFIAHAVEEFEDEGGDGD